MYENSTRGTRDFGSQSQNLFGITLRTVWQLLTNGLQNAIDLETWAMEIRVPLKTVEL
jgi:hypothetical protein